MTPVAAYRELGVPVLIGDLLVTDTAARQHTVAEEGAPTISESRRWLHRADEGDGGSSGPDAY